MLITRDVNISSPVIQCFMVYTSDEFFQDIHNPMKRNNNLCYPITWIKESDQIPELINVLEKNGMKTLLPKVKKYPDHVNFHNIITRNWELENFEYEYPEAYLRKDTTDSEMHYFEIYDLFLIYERYTSMYVGNKVKERIDQMKAQELHHHNIFVDYLIL